MQGKKNVVEETSSNESSEEENTVVAHDLDSESADFLSDERPAKATSKKKPAPASNKAPRSTIQKAKAPRKTALAEMSGDDSSSDCDEKGFEAAYKTYKEIMSQYEDNSSSEIEDSEKPQPARELSILKKLHWLPNSPITLAELPGVITELQNSIRLAGDNVTHILYHELGNALYQLATYEKKSAICSEDKSKFIIIADLYRQAADACQKAIDLSGKEIPHTYYFNLALALMESSMVSLSSLLSSKRKHSTLALDCPDLPLLERLADQAIAAILKAILMTDDDTPSFGSKLLRQFLRGRNELSRYNISTLPLRDSIMTSIVNFFKDAALKSTFSNKHHYQIPVTLIGQFCEISIQRNVADLFALILVHLHNAILDPNDNCIMQLHSAIEELCLPQHANNSSQIIIRIRSIFSSLLAISKLPGAEFDMFYKMIQTNGSHWNSFIKTLDNALPPMTLTSLIEKGPTVQIALMRLIDQLQITCHKQSEQLAQQSEQLIKVLEHSAQQSRKIADLEARVNALSGNSEATQSHAASPHLLLSSPRTSSDIKQHQEEANKDYPLGRDLST